MNLLPPTQLLVRDVSSSYGDCLRVDASVSIDVSTARRQHAAYVAALRTLGLLVAVVAADDRYPDGCFIEDAAVVTGARACMTRPGAASRRGEVVAVAAALQRHCVIDRMLEPASLDGGDVLRVGRILFVGMSSRTNKEGLEALRDVATRDGLEVLPLIVRDGLHLKSACTLADASTLVYDTRVLGDEELAAFRGAGLRCVAASEPMGANVLALGHGVLVSAAAPLTGAMLTALGLVVHYVDVSEFHKGDGALTCLSLRIPRAGGFST
jgi:dimethylargininase